MASRLRHRTSAALLAVALSIGPGCAKDSTSVFVAVDADSTVPPILILRTVVERAGDPASRASGERWSKYLGDAADRPGPFVFPFGLPLTVAETYAGPVIITIEGLDWDTHAVTARGSASATVVAQKDAEASLTLTAVATGGGQGADAGVD
jgi:hypothetical protein